MIKQYDKLSEKIRTMTDYQLRLLLFYCVGTLHTNEEHCAALLRQANNIIKDYPAEEKK